MKKYFLMIAVVCAAAAQAHAAKSCTNKAKQEGIGQLEDELDVPCNEKSAEIARGPTWHGITSYNVTMDCGGAAPNGGWVYFTSDCKDASDTQVQAYLSRGDQ